MSIVERIRRIKCRSIWISDVHLGFRGCSAKYLQQFLHASECENLYLVGDCVDFLSMRRRPFWPQEHNNVVRTILGKAKLGTRIIVIAGNHDAVLREYAGMEFGNIRIADRVIHEQPDGTRLLVMHGDQFDSVVRASPLLAALGSHAYDLLLWVNRYLTLVREKLGMPYWSLAAFLKHRVKNAVMYISGFEQAVAREAAHSGVDGIVCGHIHRAEISRINDILYCNCGDWVESCTAIVEHADSSLELIHWSDKVQSRKIFRPAA